MNNQVKQILKDCGLEIYGCIKYNNDVLPFETRNRKIIPENAKSILCCLFPYYSHMLEQKRNLSYYACVSDYHNVAMDILNNTCNMLSQVYQQNKFVAFVDNSPINEVLVAVKSGLGVLGDNSLLINKQYGSYVFLGSIVTDLQMEPTQPLNNTRCIQCGKCKTNCPTGAITIHGVDKSKCLSDITQRKGELTQEEKQIIKEKGIIWGCDICQQVCPLNKNVSETYIEQFKDNIVSYIDSDNVKEMVKTRAFGYRGIKVIQRNIDICGI